MGAIPWGNISAGGLLGFAILLLLTGRIVTRSVYRDMVTQRDKWEQAWKDSQAARDARQEAKLDASTQAMETMEKAFREFISVKDQS